MCVVCVACGVWCGVVCGVCGLIDVVLYGVFCEISLEFTIFLISYFCHMPKAAAAARQKWALDCTLVLFVARRSQLDLIAFDVLEL